MQDLVVAVGGIYASVTDLSKWRIMQLIRGKYGKDLSRELFSEKQRNEMWRLHINTFNLIEEGKEIGIKMKGISPNVDFQDLDLERVEK